MSRGLYLGMRIGFTGTRHGMTSAQERTLHGMLAARQGAHLHHGDCVGADAQAHELASLMGRHVTIHPPTNNRRRGIAQHPHSQGLPHRNKNIVRETDILIAAPAETEEQIRSGTWSTVRFARKLGKPVFVILPDGTVQLD